MKVAFGFSLAVACALLGSGQNAAAQNSNGHYACSPLPIDFVDQCTGEEIVGSGQVCVADTVKTDNAGGLHIEFQFRSDFTAVGQSSGMTYREHDSSHDDQNLNGNNSQFSFTYTENYHLNTPGGQNNLVLKDLNHITVDANGTLTAFTSKFSLECR